MRRKGDKGEGEGGEKGDGERGRERGGGEGERIQKKRYEYIMAAIRACFVAQHAMWREAITRNGPFPWTFRINTQANLFSLPLSQSMI